MADLGPIALAEAIRRNAEQQATLSATRSAASTILTASTIGSAFLAGVALDGRGNVTPVAWVALILTAATAILAMLTLLPSNIGVWASPEILAVPVWSAHDDNAAALHLARYVSERSDANVERLDLRWRLVMSAGATTTASIILWIIAIATK